MQFKNNENNTIMKKALTFLLTLIGLNVNSACSTQAFKQADVSGFAKVIEDANTQLIDVRTSEEFNESHINGAVNIDFKQDSFLENVTSTVDKARPVAVYCRSGRRSADAAAMLSEKGYDVVNLKGGIIAWEKEGMEVVKDKYEVDVFKTKSGKTLKFHALIHASIRLEYDGKEIEIDPVRQLGGREIDYASMPKADIIFVTHEHGDHFDKEAIATLSKADTRIITNARCADMMGKGEVMANGDTKALAEEIKVEAVPAYNITEGRTQFHPKGRDNGFIITIDGTRIYVAGDTEDIPEMGNIKDIDIAFLPCNQPYTMTPEQLVRAAKTIKPKVLFPYHYGKTDLSKFAETLNEPGIDVRIRQYQ